MKVFINKKMTDMWKQILDTFYQNVITFVLKYFSFGDKLLSLLPPPPFGKLGTGYFYSTVLFSSVFLFESLCFYNLMLHLECHNFVGPLPTSRWKLSHILQRWWVFLLHDNLDIVSPIKGDHQWSNIQWVRLGIRRSTV